MTMSSICSFMLRTTLSTVRQSSTGICQSYSRTTPTASLSRRPQHPICSAARLFSSSKSRGIQIRYTRFGGSSGSNWLPEGTRTQVILGLGGLASLYYVAHLEQVPETGRWRFMNVSAKFEESVAQGFREELLRENQGLVLPRDHILSRHTRRVVSRILSASNLGHLSGDTSTPHPIPPQPEGTSEIPWDPDSRYRSAGGSGRGNDREWDVVVINNPRMVNAEVIPGLIVVYTGIFPVCQDEDGLSAVLSHEIGHVVARHTAERLSSQTISLFVLAAASTLGIDYVLGKLLDTYVFQLPNSRVQELEADKIGMTLMSRACYNPQNAVQLFERMGQLDAREGRAGYAFFKTHPSSKTRVENLEKLLPDAYTVLSSNPDCSAVLDRLEAFREASFGIKERWA